MYCKNFKTKLIFPSYLCMTFTPWIRIRIGIRKEAEAAPKSGSELQPMLIHITGIKILPLGIGQQYF